MASSTDELEGLVSSSLSLNIEEARILVYGQPKVGKTTTAMTVSSLWPGEIPTKKGVVLEDVLSIAADRNANVGLRACGVTPFEFDIRKLLQTGQCKNIRDALKKAADVAAHFVDQKGVKNVIVDTVSMIDFALGKFWGSAQNMPYNERGEPDKFAMYREILNSHRNLWSDLDFLNARVVFLFHSDVNAEAVKPKQSDRDRAKLTTSTLAGSDHDVRPLITGKGGPMYIGNVDLILPMVMYGNVKSGGERKFLPFGGAGLEGGNRYHYILKEEEEANLGDLCKKIAKNAAKYVTTVEAKTTEAKS